MNKAQLLDELKQEGFSKPILEAFNKVPRENFIPKELKQYAYDNQPLPIGKGATISQPYTIAFMLELLELDKLNISNTKKDETRSSNDNDISGKSNYPLTDLSINNKLKLEGVSKSDNPKILEIGSGCGYVLALINQISSDSEIYGLEIIKELVSKSKDMLKNSKNIKIIQGDGSKGFLEKAPFDRILISASAKEIPTHLFKQLKDNGILVTPVKNSIFQFKKINNQVQSKEFPGFVFVPLINS